jgi:hypothetical protein
LDESGLYLALVGLVKAFKTFNWYYTKMTKVKIKERKLILQIIGVVDDGKDKIKI